MTENRIVQEAFTWATDLVPTPSTELAPKVADAKPMARGGGARPAGPLSSNGVERVRKPAPLVDSLPPDDELAVDFEAHMLEKALYELRYELGNRPGWVHLPLLGMQALLELDRRGRGQ